MSRVLRWAMGAALLLTVPGALAADTARTLVQQGNEHYAAGRYAEALKCYETAAQGAGGAAVELLHDQAAAHFKLGQIDEARDLWVRLKEARDPAFEARTRYNLGNCDYADALAAAQQDGQKAVKLLGQAVEQYREALQLDPALIDARANLELTQLLKRQIEAQQQQQNQGQPGQQSKDQQKQDQQQNSTQPSESQPSSQPSQDQQNDRSKDQKSQTQPSQPPESQKSSDEEQESEDEQKAKDQQQPKADEKQRPESQPTTQPSAAQSQPAEQGEEKSPPVPIEMTREQAERLLQMIRDAERQRREKLAQERVSRQKPVERDW